LCWTVEGNLKHKFSEAGAGLLNWVRVTQQTETPSSVHSEEPLRRELVRVVGVTFAFALAVSFGTYIAAGPTLGLFFGSVLMAALLVPPLCLIRRELFHSMMITASVCDGLALVWLIALFNAPVTLVQLLLCCAILAAWCVALWGLTCAIDRINSSVEIIASAIVVVAALLWLTCPIWLPASTGRSINPLLSVHPLFALNGALKELGFWTQHPLAYRYLFTLGQDVPYTLPDSVWPSVLVHGAIGLVGLGIGRTLGKT
jgi:ABC-type polysaccharide/polyol phosphate export permease